MRLKRRQMRMMKIKKEFSLIYFLISHRPSPIGILVLSGFSQHSCVSCFSFLSTPSAPALLPSMSLQTYKTGRRSFEAGDTVC
jgi:hypothetical protein